MVGVRAYVAAALRALTQSGGFTPPLIGAGVYVNIEGGVRGRGGRRGTRIRDGHNALRRGEEVNDGPDRGGGANQNHTLPAHNHKTGWETPDQQHVSPAHIRKAVSTVGQDDEFERIRR